LVPNWNDQAKAFHLKNIIMQTTTIETTTYLTIVDAIVDLQARGYLFDFSFLHNKLFCAQQKCFFEPEDFAVLEKHSFQAGKRPGNKTVVYGIESLAYGLKGILLK
jgi:hypothetical protein